MKRTLKSSKYVVVALLIGISASLFSSKASANEELAASGDVEVCPGSGERCAQVYVWGVGLWWKKKTKGGPGLIISE